MPHDDLARSASDPRRASLHTSGNANTSFQLPNSRASLSCTAEPGGGCLPAKVRKLCYWKSFSACKSFHRWSPFNKRAKLPERAGNWSVAAVAVAERGPPSIRASRVEPYSSYTHLTGVWRSSGMTRTTRALPPVCFGIHVRS